MEEKQRGRVRGLGEVVVEYLGGLSKRTEALQNRQWGEWRFNEDDMELEHLPTRRSIPLRGGLDSSWEMIDTLYEEMGKGYLSPQALWDFLEATDALLRPRKSFEGLAAMERVNVRALVAENLPPRKPALDRDEEA